MSLRGRVIRRSNVACYLTPQSIQDQKRDYEYLARILRIPQNQAQSFSGFYTWSLYMTNNDLWLSVKDIYPAWDGKPTAKAVRLPVKAVGVLDIWIENLAGTTFTAPSRVGFMYKMADGGLNVSFETFAWGGKVIPANTICRLTATSSPEYPLHTTMIGTQYQYQKGTWSWSTSEPVECYFVHPFFDIEVKTNSKPSQVVMVQPKV